ncbi:hypothetical protein [Horticoccus sp. 23ND18S-11]|uniref:hypothetical protein n=1 Tax=Horticoccus sp. 23ND18S-11 TaxID=3391832 RepID=UPI0039C969B0
MSSPAIHPDIEFCESHREQLADRYAGKVVVIKDQQVVRIYEREDIARREAEKEFTPGSFLIRRIEPVRRLHRV